MVFFIKLILILTDNNKAEPGVKQGRKAKGSHRRDSQVVNNFSKGEIQMKKLLAGLVTGLTILALTSVSQATMTPISITGEVTNGFGGINDNDSVLINFLYDDSLGYIDTCGNCAHYPGATLQSFTIGSFSYSGTPSRQDVWEVIPGQFTSDPPTDWYSAGWTPLVGSPQGELNPQSLEITLSGPGSTYDGFTSLPTSSEILELSTGSGTIQFSDSAWDTQFGSAYFTITDIQVAPVPEPATMLLFVLGLLGLTGVNRRK